MRLEPRAPRAVRFVPSPADFAPSLLDRVRELERLVLPNELLPRRQGRVAVDGAELREAKRKIRLLEQENEVLRRAAAYLSQANLRLGQSPK